MVGQYFFESVKSKYDFILQSVQNLFNQKKTKLHFFFTEAVLRVFIANPVIGRKFFVQSFHFCHFGVILSSLSVSHGEPI